MLKRRVSSYASSQAGNCVRRATSPPPPCQLRWMNSNSPGSLRTFTLGQASPSKACACRARNAVISCRSHADRWLDRRKGIQGRWRRVARHQMPAALELFHSSRQETILKTAFDSVRCMVGFGCGGEAGQATRCRRTSSSVSEPRGSIV
jgi:hypothetical protein